MAKLWWAPWQRQEAKRRQTRGCREWSSRVMAYGASRPEVATVDAEQDCAWGTTSDAQQTSTNGPQDIE